MGTEARTHQHLGLDIKNPFQGFIDHRKRLAAAHAEALDQEKQRLLSAGLEVQKLTQQLAGEQSGVSLELESELVDDLIISRDDEGTAVVSFLATTEQQPGSGLFGTVLSTDRYRVEIASNGEPSAVIKNEGKEVDGALIEVTIGRKTQIAFDDIERIESTLDPLPKPLVLTSHALRDIARILKPSVPAGQLSAKTA